jgi:hypothetical protein
MKKTSLLLVGFKELVEKAKPCESETVTFFNRKRVALEQLQAHTETFKRKRKGIKHIDPVSGS